MSEWPIIGFWMPDQPIIGECGNMPWDRRPWCTYIVLPFGQRESYDGWTPCDPPDLHKWKRFKRRYDA